MVLSKKSKFTNNFTEDLFMHIEDNKPKKKGSIKPFEIVGNSQVDINMRLNACKFLETIKLNDKYMNLVKDIKSIEYIDNNFSKFLMNITFNEKYIKLVKEQHEKLQEIGLIRFFLFGLLKEISIKIKNKIGGFYGKKRIK